MSAFLGPILPSLSRLWLPRPPKAEGPDVGGEGRGRAREFPALRNVPAPWSIPGEEARRSPSPPPPSPRKSTSDPLSEASVPTATEGKESGAKPGASGGETGRGALEGRNWEGAILFATTVGKPSATPQVSDFLVCVAKKRERNPTPTRVLRNCLSRNRGKSFGRGEGKAERNSHAVTWAISRIKGRSAPLASSCQRTRSERQRTPRNSAQRLLRPRSSDPRTSTPPPTPRPARSRDARPGPAALRCRGALRCRWVSSWRLCPGFRGSVHPGWVSAQTSPGDSRYYKYSQNSEAESGRIAPLCPPLWSHGPVIAPIFSHLLNRNGNTNLQVVTRRSDQYMWGAFV